jgi:hypothetical protein
MYKFHFAFLLRCLVLVAFVLSSSEVQAQSDNYYDNDYRDDYDSRQRDLRDERRDLEREKYNVANLSVNAIRQKRFPRRHNQPRLSVVQMAFNRVRINAPLKSGAEAVKTCVFRVVWGVCGVNCCRVSARLTTLLITSEEMCCSGPAESFSGRESGF